ncbi:MAG: pyridoxal phosphate-dependent aminotransferase [Rhodothermales bacterium]
MASDTPKPLAARTENLVQSDIRAVTHLINRVGGINLGQGICDLPTPEAIKAGAHAAIDEDRSIYTSYAGIPELRQAIFQKARTFNRIPAGDEDEVMVSIGSTGAFVSAIFALLDPGDEVILFEPFYGYHRNLLRLPGASMRFVTMRGADWQIDFDEVERAITPATKAVVINTPGNPCGKVWTREELQNLLALMQRYNLYAITDEIYEYMTYDGCEHVSLASLPGAYERTVTISGFSKTYNMTGWRLGYAVAPPPLIEKMGLLNDLFSICAPAPLQHGVARSFDLEDTYYAGMLADYAAKRRMMCDALETAGFTFSRPQGAYYVLASFEALSRTRPGYAFGREACETLIQEAGVATVPGDSFYSDPERGRYLLRFCYAKEFPILEQACRQLVDAFTA